jgi:spermidine synthase
LSSRNSYFLLAFVFLAGMLTMLCQIIWIRQFTTIFGVHAISVTTLLASFTGCMAIGSFLFGKIADTKINKWFLFALMQAAEGIFILLHPFLFHKVVDFYLLLNGHLNLGSYSVMFIRGTVSFFYFLIPASIMGGSLPVLGKPVVRQMSAIGRQFGRFYGFFLSGTGLGIFLTGFVLIRSFGLQHTLFIAASFSLLMALASAGLFFSEKRRRIHTSVWGTTYASEEFVTIAAGKWKRRLLRIFLAGSFASMTCKIIWTRIMLESSADKTVYFFTLLSVCFMVCLAIGSFVACLFTDKIKKTFFTLANIEILIGLLSLLSLGLFNETSPFLSAFAASGFSWMGNGFRTAGVMLVLLFIPVCLTGLVFPLVMRMYAEDIKTLGSKIGNLGALDITGALAASFVITFLFIPLAGTHAVFMGTALVNVGIGIFILLRYRRIRNSVRATLTLASIVLFIGIAFLFSEKKADQSRNHAINGEVPEIRKEGTTATVDVHKNNNGDIILYINGEKAVSSDPLEMKSDKLMAYIPCLFKPDAKRVFLIGLGIGITAKSIADLEIPELDIAEISPEVTRVAADAYAYVNNNILAYENISITIEDGRSLLLRSKELYDMIICSAAHPRIGNALYTEEFYRLCRKKLSREGIMGQWMPQGWLSEDEFRSLIKACTDVFPYVTLWQIAPGQNLLLASMMPLRLDYCRSRDRFDAINGQGDLTSSGISEFNTILAGYIADDKALREYARGASVNSDLYPRVEFSRFTGNTPDQAILKQLSSFRVRFEHLISFDSCPEMAGEVLNDLARKNSALKEKTGGSK